MDITKLSPRSGRVVAENGQTRNIVDMLGGGTPVNNEVYDISKLSPISGRLIGEDGRIYNEVTLLIGIANAINNVKESIDDMGLSVNDGQLCQTYNI